MPYAGATAPEGWVLCKGQSISGVEGGDALRALIGVNAPNLQGMFLRGTGTNPVNSQDGPTLRGTQGDTFKEHNHPDNFSIGAGGKHRHNIEKLPYDNIGSGNYQTVDDTGGSNESWQYIGGGQNAISEAPNHSHAINGSGNNSGDAETRPVNYGVNYIIKL